LERDEKVLNASKGRQNMKKLMIGLLAVWAGVCGMAQEIGPLSLDGKIVGEYLTMEMIFSVKGLKANVPLDVLSGDLALLEEQLPKGVTLEVEGNSYKLSFKGGFWQKETSGDVRLRFALNQRSEGEKQSVSFSVPVVPTRKISVTCDRPGLAVELANAHDVVRDKDTEGNDRASGYLGFSPDVKLSWKTAVRKLDSELIATCDALTSVTVVPGTMRLKTILTYRVAQGELTSMAIDVPNMNVIQVKGLDLRDWSVDKTNAAKPQLRITLGRPQRETYRLEIESERSIPAFPCEFMVDSLNPQGVIRSAGMLLVGTDSAVRIQIATMNGLTQTDPSAFPLKTFGAAPARSVYTYQYAAVPYSVSLKADDIVTSMTAETGVLCKMEEGILTVEANVQLDVRDAPAREVRLLTDADASWTVSSVSGQHVAESDVDVRTSGTGREIIIPFRKPVEGMAVITIRLEKTLTPGSAGFTVPSLSLPDARSQRGYVVAAAARGIRLTAKTAQGMTEVHTASTPIRTEGVQVAYRFREAGWKLDLSVERAKSSLHAELFHLISLGEGVVYVSTAVTCHISGAPVQSLMFRIPEHITLFDITGANIDTWTREKDVCTVKLMNRVIGDYTLLITYDRPLNYKGGDLQIGEIEMIETESEMGYLAIATAASLKLDPLEMPQTLIRIGREEIPAGYAATVTAPVIGAYKYVRRPHAATLKVTPYATEGLIGQVADYLTLTTKIARDCESVTKALYSLKNAVRQYLSLKLPEGSVLWSVRQITDDDPTKAKDLSAQQADGVLLVPVERPRDPNRAVTIEVIYAHVGIKGTRTTTLTAPMLTDAPVTFAKWEVEADAKVSISHAEGNMTPEVSIENMKWPIYNPWAARSQRFYRTANLAREAPLQLTVTIVPAWLGGGSLRVLGGGLIVGLLSLVIFAFRRKKMWLAIALTCLGLAIAQTKVGLLVATVLLAVLLPVLVLTGIVRVILRWIRNARARKEASKDAEPPVSDPFEMPLPLEDEKVEESPVPDVQERVNMENDENKGFARIGLMLCIAVIGFAGLTLTAEEKQTEAQAVVAPDVQKVELLFANNAEGITVLHEKASVSVAPRTLTGEYVSTVKRVIAFTAKAVGEYRLLQVNDVNQLALLTFKDHEQAKITVDQQGILLTLKKPGTYTLEIETCETIRENETGSTFFSWGSYGSVKSSVEVVLPSAELAVTGKGITQCLSTPANGKTTVTGVLTTGTRRFGVSFSPRVRDSRKETAVIYCDVSTLAFLRSGVVDISANANYTVAQGEVRELHLKIPASMGVTSVTAAGLATWSLDPTTRMLTVIFEKPQTGAFTVALGLQSASGGLPYAVTLGAPSAEGVQRQRGFLALAAAEAVLMKIEKDQGVNAINVADYPMAAALLQQNKEEPIRRAYRYDDATKVAVTFRAEAVQSEIRVVETGAFSIADERSVLSTRLDVTIAKAGLFSLKLDPPKGYEIETLTGSGVSHWDDTRKTGGSVEVFFNTRLLGMSSINMVLARQLKGIEEKIVVPRVSITNALRHTGRMAVTAERGVRLVPEAQQGVTLVRDDTLRNQTGAVVFDILRPGWQMELKTQVLLPVLKPELLHRVDLAEGMLQHRIYARYKIENAGVKFFRVFVPIKDATLTVSGRNIARVYPEVTTGKVETADAQLGAAGKVWVIELHGKVEDSYAFTALYQEPYDPAAGGVKVSPFGTPGSARQTAWVAITGGGRVQVEPRGEVVGLRVEDARSLPEYFGAGDLSGAIRCYRVLQSDYTLDLSVIRHESAKVLPAGVESARFTTVLSASGKMLTQVSVQLRTGRLRFLKIGMPATSQLWAAQVNGTEVAIARDSENNLNIPLELLSSEKLTSIDLVYADSLKGIMKGTMTIPAIRFPELPLQNIQWTIFVPPGSKYRLANQDFDELDLKDDPEEGGSVRSFGLSQYQAINAELGSRNLKEAKGKLGSIGALLDKGDRIQAQKALQQAVNLSQAEQTLNEDARVQFKNVVREQVKIGLVNRREALRMDNNIYDERAPQTQVGYNDGNFSREFANRVDEQLTVQDRDSLDRVATKIVEQQAAAAGQGTAINIAMPEHGRMLRFARALQNECGGKLELSLKVSSDYSTATVLTWWPVIPLFLGLWLMLRVAFGPQRKA
jgi:hypothetical protein